ncbi:MAG: hypothetical protein D9C04_06410 [Nitrosopumilus sp. B06]|nr:MAG: hypothetical protein EB828_01400 [Nitrosopumilus sp. D6]RNJ78875.1 MAG: hypothetical protein D9C04_06410 [Nitrosopumilus sp. B06]
MKFEQTAEPDVKKPIIIAAMQDMGNVGSIVVDFVNRSLNTKIFRTASLDHPTHVLDCGGYIEVPDERWEYRYADDIIIFGGGRGQPHGAEMGELCQDVINVASRYSAKFIYTLGGFHTEKANANPRTFITTTSQDLTKQMEGIGVHTTPQKSIITGFNGLILGFAKQNGMHGIGMYGELDRPDIEQYGAAVSIIKTLERLTYRKLGDTGDLEAMTRS